MLSIRDRVLNVVAVHMQMDPDNLEDENNIRDDLGADSLDAVEMVMALEEEFDIEIPDEDLEKILTIGGMVEYVEKKKGG